MVYLLSRLKGSHIFSSFELCVCGGGGTERFDGLLEIWHQLKLAAIVLLCAIMLWDFYHLFLGIAIICS